MDPPLGIALGARTHPSAMWPRGENISLCEDQVAVGLW